MLATLIEKPFDSNEWLFEIKKMRTLKPVNPKAKYPKVIERIGRNPVQYPRYE